MTEARKLNLILCWHMHQPDYRHYETGEFSLPWTYLHAIKDYTDMAYHLETQPEVKAVFNFVPVLLDQLEDYAEQFESGNIRDPLLRLLAQEDLDTLTDAQRELVMDSCYCCNHDSMIQPYPAYQRLRNIYALVEEQGEKHLSYLSGQYIADVLTWYHLAWTGESVRRTYELVPNLMAKGTQFSFADRKRLFDLVGELIRGIISRYKKLADEGRIELSTTPHYHPIMPLLIDLKSTHESMPEASLPQSSSYPGGVERASFHTDSAIESHRRRFGKAPLGMWPAEGSVSQATLLLLAQHGCHWAASGEGVLANSLRRIYNDQPLPEKAQYLYRPYLVRDDTRHITCFFRDDRLSDLIGFEYAKWYGRDAVRNFIHELEQIYRNAPTHESAVVSVIMDGENAWEYYPYNGYYFLSELYQELAAHPFIQTTTFGEYLAACAPDHSGQQAELDLLATAAPSCPIPGVLPHVVAGSWVYGTFSTWIGSPDKNRAWDLLCAAKQNFDLVMASGRLNEEEKRAALKQLADCEGSDWFWWFGDYNPSHSVESFDKLYRENLANLYRLIKLPVPQQLSEPISHGGGEMEAGGTMRRAS